jgi:ATP-dependent RNA circularization protein (DNA/RNA ligase family)
MNGKQLKTLGQKAFALVTGVNPEEVLFEEGLVYHKCRWRCRGNAIEGIFFHDHSIHSDSGTVCITSKIDEGEVVWSFPHTWHHLWRISSDSPVVA